MHGDVNLFFNVTFSIYLVYLVRELELSPGVIGLLFAVGSVGSLLAAFTHDADLDRFGIGPTTIAEAALNLPALLLIALAPAGFRDPVPRPGGVVLGFAIVVYNITQVTYRQAISPPRLQGRMNSVMRFIVWGTIPIGTLLGGVLGSTIGLRETLVVGALGSGSSFLWILLSPQRHLREMPEPIEDEPRTTELGGLAAGAATRCRR